MSSITTYTGPRSAKERASQAWGAAHGERLHEQEQRRHERLIAATRRIAPKSAVRVSRFESGDRDYWRRTARANGVITGTCRKCLGKGWVAVPDGTGCIDFDECPRCSWFEPYTDDYPTADDAVEVKF